MRSGNIEQRTAGRARSVAGTLGAAAGMVCLLAACGSDVDSVGPTATGGQGTGAGGSGGQATGGQAVGGQAVGGAAQGGGGAGATGGTPPIPELTPVTEEQAEAIGAYARRLRTVSNGGDPSPVAWSMVNISCQDRSMALQYAIAAAGDPLESEPPLMVDSELTLERVQELAQDPRYSVASINITGPLVTHQSFRSPGGTTLPGEADFWYWSYHHGVVLDVAGELRVMDLSIGDAPIPIDVWAASFTEPGIECQHLEESEYQQIWTYWTAAWGNLEPGERPETLCAYTLTPMFVFRWDQTPEELADAVGAVPATMETQLGAFDFWLSTYHDTTLPEADLPFVTSLYEPGVEQEVCDLVSPQYCETL